MRVLKARVKGGRLLLDEPTDLPDGTEVQLTPADEAWLDGMDADERRRLLRAIDNGIEDFERGDYVEGEELLAELDRRREAANR
jgi:hypothetical protein